METHPVRRYSENSGKATPPETNHPDIVQYFQVFHESLPDPRVGSRGFQNVAGRVGSGHCVLNYHGSGRAGSRSFEISRVGSGRVMTV